jgi:hypothetical protein
VGDCDSETDLLTLNTLYCEEATVRATDSVPVIKNVTSTSTTQASINQNASSITNDDIIKIIGGVVVISLFFIILLTFFIMTTFVVKQRRTSASMNATDPIEMSTQRQMLHNTISKSSIDSNQAYTTREEDKHDEIVDCIEMDDNQAYITQSETKGEKGADKKENQAYIAIDTLPTDPNVAYGTVDCIEVDTNQAYGINTVPTNPNVAYGTNTIPTDPNVAYGTYRDSPQTNNYDYVTLP